MAKIYTGISPGIVPVESLFSVAGFLLNSKRSMMAPYKADMVTFVQDNYGVVMERLLAVDSLTVEYVLSRSVKLVITQISIRHSFIFCSYDNGTNF